MRVVVDTNIVFSAILNTNNRISRIILQPKSTLNLYTTYQLEQELLEHWNKLLKLSGYSNINLHKIVTFITSRITFINVQLIPAKLFVNAAALCSDIDIDDTEFVALTEHIKGKLWTGDKALANGLIRKRWNKIITTQELYNNIIQ